MTVLYFVGGSAVYRLCDDQGTWSMEEMSTPHPFMCLAVDPMNPHRLYAGTFDHGLWLSNDRGQTWNRAGEGITHDRVLSVAISPVEVTSGYGVVWAGTEPSHLFRSEDGGQTWADCPALRDLPSRDTWRFPPRPHTHHVSWIQPDVHDENMIFAGIELGGVMKSTDKGASWQDRKPDSQFDCHSLTMHQQAKGRIYEAAGGGYAESTDYGQTWRTINDGLDPYSYLVNIAVDSSDPDKMVASAAKAPRTAYKPETASTVLVRRTQDQPWQIVKSGLPDPDGAIVFDLVTHPAEPGVFYAVNNTGAYRSDDSGQTWQQLPVNWPNHLTDQRIRGLVAI